MDHTEFIIHLDRIPPEGLERDLEISDPASAGFRLAVPLRGPLRVKAELTRIGNKILARGRISLSVGLTCSRCLEVFAFQLENGLDACMQVGNEIEEEGADEDRRLSSEEMEVQPLAKGAVDLREIIAEQIHLGLPVKPLCAENCKGLCPRCGVDLNRESCSCSGEQGDSRWETLKQLKVE